MLREEPYDVDPDTKNPKRRRRVSGLFGFGRSHGAGRLRSQRQSGRLRLLKKHGIEVRGKIVLVRYSNPYSYRGFKALTAEKQGAAAILIYSDPAEDGFKKGAVFPDGPWGPESHIQRGAITYDFLEPGDPLTPGWASVPGAKRIPIRAGQYRSRKLWACRFPGTMRSRCWKIWMGPWRPTAWQGGLPFKYRTRRRTCARPSESGHGHERQPYYVTEARIRGGELPDEWVILGNHRDAWVYGAVDPSSGTASMLELTRGLGQIVEAGNSPAAHFGDLQLGRRGIRAHGLDGVGRTIRRRTEEKGCRVSERGRGDLRQEFSGDAVGSLAPVLVEVSRTLPAPSGKTLYDEWKVSRHKSNGTTTSPSPIPNSRTRASEAARTTRCS